MFCIVHREYLSKPRQVAPIRREGDNSVSEVLNNLEKK
jgi:hypothetical protein